MIPNTSPTCVDKATEGIEGNTEADTVSQIVRRSRRINIESTHHDSEKS